MMVKPPLKKLESQVDSKYTCLLYTSKKSKKWKMFFPLVKKSKLNYNPSTLKATNYPCP